MPPARCSGKTPAAKGSITTELVLFSRHYNVRNGWKSDIRGAASRCLDLKILLIGKKLFYEALGQREKAMPFGAISPPILRRSIPDPSSTDIYFSSMLGT